MDFSRYGGSCAEWDAVQATLPQPSIQPGEAIHEQVDKVNKVREETAQSLLKTLEKQVDTKDYAIPTRDGSTVEARTYQEYGAGGDGKLLPAYIHLHGGGFVFGNIGTEDFICSDLAIRTGTVVINVNYRHTPDHPYPTAWDDVEDAFVWVHDNIEQLGVDKNQVVMGGISAGAWLTASLTLRQSLGMAATSCPPLAGQVLMIPALVHKECYGPQLKQLTDPSISSHAENEDAPILPKATVDLFNKLLQVVGLGEKETDLKLNPGNATIDQVKGLPPTTFGIAGLDPLRDEGLLYAKLLTEAGIPTDVHLFKGVPHGFRKFGDKLSASKRWDEVMAKGIKYGLSKPAATGKFVIQSE